MAVWPRPLRPTCTAQRTSSPPPSQTSVAAARLAGHPSCSGARRTERFASPPSAVPPDAAQHLASHAAPALASVFDVASTAAAEAAARLLSLPSAVGLPAAPPPLLLEPVALPCSTMGCGDLAYRATLDRELRNELRAVSPYIPVVVAFALVYLTARPGPLQGAWDTYVEAPRYRRRAQLVGRVVVACYRRCRRLSSPLSLSS